MMLSVDFPNEPFNSLVRSGEIDQLVGQVLEAIQPEAVYFTEQDGLRGAILIVDVKRPSDIPALAEPFFLNFDAECRFRIVMTPEDLQGASLSEHGQRWP
jgi:hypothetical protein